MEGDRQTDLAIVGSGVAGLTAALSARLRGLECIVLEHASELGGTSARSSGTVWVPDNHLMRAAGLVDDRPAAEAYLEALIGNRGDRGLWMSFLDNAPKMLRDLEEEADISFRPYAHAPDYRQDKPGAAAGWRPLEPMPFDGRRLGADFERVASPLPELMLFGGMMITRGEAAELIRFDRSLSSLALAIRLVGRFGADRLRHHRGTRLVLGNALVGRLLYAATMRRVEVVTGARPARLHKSGARVAGIDCVIDGREQTILARRGVILAGGGFPAGPKWRKANLPEPTATHTPAAEGCDGSSIQLGLDAGAGLGPSLGDNALWFPSSIAVRRDGSTAVYPHIVLDRAKPGSLVVNAVGERFVNEAVSYHEFVRAMHAANRRARAIPAWMVCTGAFIAKYGFGLIRPRTLSLRRHVASGYLKTGRTLAELAGAIGAPADRLEASIARFNAFAWSGDDLDFRRGNSIYDRSNGDPSHRPNPCLGPVREAPFYAVALYPTPLGTSRGLRTDSEARVLGEGGDTIAGLYACGNDMQSAFAGEYPGAGAQLGPAMTFAWLAARAAAADRTIMQTRLD